MKNMQQPGNSTFIRWSLLLSTIGVFFLSACTKKYADYNTNPYQATLEQQDPDNYFVGKNFPIMINAVTPAGDPSGKTDYINSYQVAYNLAADCFSGFMGEAGDWGGNSNNLTYAFNLDWVNEQFSLTGKLMSAWKQVKDATDLNKDSLTFSVAQIIKVTGIIRATDSYGPIPYTSILTGTFTPAYDSQESIYTSAFADLIKARDILYKFGSTAGAQLKLYDMIYAGDYTLWAKYANSLVLRLAMRISYVDPAKAKTYAEEAVGNPAGLLASVSEGATHSLKSENGAFNFNNPLAWLSTNYHEARAGASMQSILSGYGDPRLAVYYKNSTIIGHTSDIVGVRSGINVTRSLYQPFSELNVDANTPMPWMQASEVYFLKAEGAIRGWNMGGSAKDFYEAGIKEAFAETGATMPANYLTSTAKPAAYVDYATAGNNVSGTNLDTISVAWVDAATFKVKLHRIMNQKWVALYPNGAEAWADYRRTGYPRIFPVMLNKSGGAINTDLQVRRIPYPIAQYNQNRTEVLKGISLLDGPDNGGTKLWWDKNTTDRY
ncbi:MULTISPECIES: SusD/RagB family nutrient-binding outer membrane lipoprotein [Chitinophagaceae]